jgi:hypothetical protein
VFSACSLCEPFISRGDAEEAEAQRGRKTLQFFRLIPKESFAALCASFGFSAVEFPAKAQRCKGSEYPVVSPYTSVRTTWQKK